MKIVYTYKARESLQGVANYLLRNSASKAFVRDYLTDIRSGIRELLSVFPEAGVVQNIDGYTCRRIMVMRHSVLYRYLADEQLIQVLLVYRQNLPSL